MEIVYDDAELDRAMDALSSFGSLGIEGAFRPNGPCS
ncbi:MAG: hypothetical protein CM1200mP26_30170 [Acidimicrobiales bacterium]|nr:MAG: hypothetical protein CM1200mP26_30170 [Acidimicrobiales bacterium]